MVPATRPYQQIENADYLQALQGLAAVIGETEARRIADEQESSTRGDRRLPRRSLAERTPHLTDLLRQELRRRTAPPPAESESRVIYCDYITSGSTPAELREIAGWLEELQSTGAVDVEESRSRHGELLGWRLQTKDRVVAKANSFSWFYCGVDSVDWHYGEPLNVEEPDYELTEEQDVARAFGETTFHRTWATGYTWSYKADFEAVEKPADLAAILANIAADIAEVQTLCATPGITLDDVTFDKRDGYLFHFTTTDAALAEKLGFEELS